MLAATPGAQAAAPSREEQLQQVGNEFEAMMMQLLFQQMQASSIVETDGGENPFAPSHAEKIYRSMQDQQMMQTLAGRRSLGVGDMVVRSLKGEGGIGRRAPVNPTQGAR